MNTDSKKLIPAVAAAAGIICGIVRFFQVISLTDYNTGFFLSGAEFGGALIYILLAVSGIALTLLLFMGHNKGRDAAYSVASDGMGDNATRFLGMSEMLAALLFALCVFEENAGICRVSGVIAAVLMLVSGCTLVGRIIPPAYTGYIKLAAAVHIYLRLGFLFDSDIIIARHPEKLIVLLAYVFGTTFVTALGRFYARLETTKTRRLETVTASLTFVISMTHVISFALTKLFGGAEAAGFVTFNPDVCAFAVMSGTFLAVLFFTSKKKDITPIVLE
ncbi:MAG: hypothetical protein IK990_08945 [Ruminiclostridium sp.]|nr:hypothetical protein [Ruminiclostridium sp.]